MIASIIVEGEQDRLFIDSVLRSASLQQPFEVVVAGGRSSAISLARSYLTLPDHSVGLVVDSETTFRRQLLEQESNLADLVSAIAPRWRSRVFLAIPELESCLFEPQIASLAFKQSLSAETMISGRFEPKKTAMELLGVTEAGYTRALKLLLASPELLAKLSTALPFRDIIEFVEAAATAEHTATRATVA